MEGREGGCGGEAWQGPEGEALSAGKGREGLPGHAEEAWCYLLCSSKHEGLKLGRRSIPTCVFRKEASGRHVRVRPKLSLR